MRPTITCGCGCERRGEHHAHGWIHSCYVRWIQAGKPESGPPPLTPPGSGLRTAYLDRLEDYTWIRAQGVNLHGAAAQVRIASTTAYKYEQVYAAVARAINGGA